MKNKIKLPKGWELKKLEAGVYEVVKKHFKLELGKDYISEDSETIVIDRVGDSWNNGFYAKPFSGSKEYIRESITCSKPSYWKEVTEEQVKEAFEKELVRRYGEGWRNVKIKRCMYHGDEYTNEGLNSVDINKYDGVWMAWNKNGCLFNGKEWAEVLEETKYAEKLEDIDRPFLIESSGKIYSYYKQGANYFTTKERAEQVLALIQLIAFRDDIWANGGYGNCGIKTSFSGLETHEGSHGLFSFKDKETCEYFIEKHRDLLEIYSGIFKK